MNKITILVLLAIFLNSCQWLTDNSDKTALEKHFEIPEDAEMVAYDGFPTMVGFGQREGLNISAKYLLSDKDMNKWIKNMSSKGLKTLPIPTECRDKLWFEDKLVPIDTKTGFYYCRTAGNDVLNADSTKLCEQVDNLNDIIFAILDTDRKGLSVIICSGY